MLRSEITAAARRVLAALDVSGVLVLFDTLRGPTEAVDPEVIFATFQKYQHEAAKFSAHELALTKVFCLDKLADPHLWSLFVKDAQGRHEAMFSVRRGILFSREYLPKLTQLLERDVELPDLVPAGDDGALQTLEVILAEAKGAFSSPQRIIKALDSIQKMYEACARIHKENEDGLSIISIDSGSDKTFDFLGAAKVVEEIRKIVLDLWDRVVFFRERKFEQRLELITTALPVLERIDEMGRNGSVAREECEIIKREIIDGASLFLDLQRTPHNTPEAS